LRFKNRLNYGEKGKIEVAPYREVVTGKYHKGSSWGD
jgi:hypothetical protein